jgi:mannitol/fructose-specific phosphotransferase system IIA component (Ntr-type)
MHRILEVKDSKELTSTELPGCLADYTGPGLIVPQLRQRDAAGVVKELSQVLYECGCVPDVLTFYNAVLNHDFLVNSVVDCGIALPHARLHGVMEARFAFGRSREPLIWRRGSVPVQFVFLLAVPATDAAGFLQLLSALARLGQQEHLLSALRSQNSAELIFRLLQEVRIRQR